MLRLFQSSLIQTNPQKSGPFFDAPLEAALKWPRMTSGFMAAGDRSLQPTKPAIRTVRMCRHLDKIG
jgi:hypothetical protein